MTKIEELKQAAQDAEDALAQAWVNLRDWMKLNRLNVSPQRAHVIGQSKEVDQVVGHWTEWHMMSYDPGLHCSDGIKLVRAIADAGLVLENADRDVHDYSVYHVFTRSIGAMMSGTGAVQRSNRTYDALPRAVFDLRQEMLCGSHVEHGVAVAYIWHGSKNFGFDDDGELFGDEPDATLVISDALIKRNYKFHDITITGVMQNPFIEVTCAS
jgi:hypothetical protein